MVFFSNCLFEAVFSAPTGMTMGYFKKIKKFHPQYGPVREKHRQFMLEMERVLLPYTQSVARKTEKPGADRGKRRAKAGGKAFAGYLWAIPPRKRQESTAAWNFQMIFWIGNISKWL